MGNILANKVPGVSRIYKMDVAVTYRCNARCTYCGIWKTRENEELLLGDYERFFSAGGFSWVHFTGGEPFIRKDFAAIVASAMQGNNLAIADTSTNGILKEKILDDCSEILAHSKGRFEVGVSLDGTREIHDRSRGVKCFDMVLSTFLELREMSRDHDNLGVHINHVLTPMNIGTLDEFVQEMSGNGIRSSDISFEVARKTDFFRNGGTEMPFDEEKLKSVISGIIGQYKAGDFRSRMRKAYLRRMLDFLGGKPVRCAAGRVSLFLDPQGFVHPCSEFPHPLGNIKEQELNEIMKSGKLASWRRNACSRCLSGCEGMVSLLQKGIL
jgi:MoaA/NifB/PqqE/SkfB family radical SAM enzyme